MEQFLPDGETDFWPADTVILYTNLDKKDCKVSLIQYLLHTVFLRIIFEEALVWGEGGDYSVEYGTQYQFQLHPIKTWKIKYFGVIAQRSSFKPFVVCMCISRVLKLAKVLDFVKSYL